MNFERGRPAKEALGIGEIAIAPVIEALYILDPSNMVEAPDGTFSPMKSNMSEHGATEHLKAIHDGEPRRKLRFYSFHDTEGNYKRLSEHKGLYVEYKGKKYKINA